MAFPERGRASYFYSSTFLLKPFFTPTTVYIAGVPAIVSRLSLLPVSAFFCGCCHFCLLSVIAAHQLQTVFPNFSMTV